MKNYIQFATHYNAAGEYISTPRIVNAYTKKSAAEKLGVKTSQVYKYN